MPHNRADLLVFENAWLALKPALNSMYITNGGQLQHSPESIQAIKDSLGSGPEHHSYGTKRTTAEKWTSMLTSPNRIRVYEYTPDFEYTGRYFESIKHAHKLTSIHPDKMTKFIDTSVILGGHLYSSTR